MSQKTPYEIAVDMHNAESQRYWDRNNVFLLLNGGLLALLGTSLSQDSILHVTISIIGTFVSYMWFIILMRGKDLIARWSSVVHQIESNFPEAERIFHLADSYSTEEKDIYRLPLLNYPASKIMHRTAIVVFIGWLFSAGFFGYQIVLDGTVQDAKSTANECS